MKIGIMTMHRVQNMGSVLQAYALQYKINQLGYDSELIDYVFPPNTREEGISVKDVVVSIWNFFQGSPDKQQQKKIEDFRRTHLLCSKDTYDRDSLLADPPQYDIYCTGSDQVWNPYHVGTDTSFMMDFASDNAPRIAFASSFASKKIEEPYYSLYLKHLSRYRSITVREQSGVDIIKAMTGKDAKVVCDPTLLLTAEEWGTIANTSTVKLQGKYILVYLLGYMFNPRPGFYNIVETVRQTLRLPIFHYNPYTADSLRRGIKALKGMGPADFVRLIKNASFVITDSFHGAAFATIFNVPMIGVVKDEQDGDGRIATLRAKVGGSQSIVCYNHPFDMLADEVDFFRCDSERVELLRQFSTEELEKMIIKCQDNENTEYN